MNFWRDCLPRLLFELSSIAIGIIILVDISSNYDKEANETLLKCFAIYIIFISVVRILSFNFKDFLKYFDIFSIIVLLIFACLTSNFLVKKVVEVDKTETSMLLMVNFMFVQLIYSYWRFKISQIEE